MSNEQPPKPLGLIDLIKRLTEFTTVCSQQQIGVQTALISLVALLVETGVVDKSKLIATMQAAVPPDLPRAQAVIDHFERTMRLMPAAQGGEDAND